MTTDLPKGLPVSTISVPSLVISTWNEKSGDNCRSCLILQMEFYTIMVICYFFPFDNGKFIKDIERFYYNKRGV